jgi:hypothetical protein
MGMTKATDVWIGRGFNPQQGRLQLAGDRLKLEIDDRVVFDARIAELGLTWPWYGAGRQFWAHNGADKYFISFLHTNNTLFSWWRGMQRGRYWNRAIKAAAAGLPFEEEDPT